MRLMGTGFPWSVLETVLTIIQCHECTSAIELYVFRWSKWWISHYGYFTTWKYSDSILQMRKPSLRYVKTFPRSHGGTESELGMNQIHFAQHWWSQLGAKCWGYRSKGLSPLPFLLHQPSFPELYWFPFQFGMDQQVSGELCHSKPHPYPQFSGWQGTEAGPLHLLVARWAPGTQRLTFFRTLAVVFLVGHSSALHDSISPQVAEIVYSLFSCKNWEATFEIRPPATKESWMGIHSGMRSIAQHCPS